MLLSQAFSSLIENNNSALNNTSADLLNGLKVFHNNQWYICGNLALYEGQAPHKLINSSPNDLDYQLLVKAAMLLVADNVEQPLTITTGFPYATYRIYKDIATEELRKTHIIDHDSSTYGGSGKKTVILDVKNVDVIPEIVGCSIALRKGEEQASGNFFILSCGFGTFESVLSMDSGVVEQSMISTHGLRYAINYMINELSKSHYLELRTAHTLDEAFQKGHLFIDKKNVDVREIRKNALKSYYSEVISPNLRNVITDKNLSRANKIYLCGGGMYYQDLVDCFKTEFGDVAQIEVVKDPAALASKGYALNSARISGGLEKSSIGIDIGNSTTVVTRFAGEQLLMFSFFRKKEPLTTLSSISNIGGLIKEGGDYLSDELILLDDKPTANLYCSDKIIIETSGHLSGNICGNVCVISGTVIGNVTSTGLLEIKKTAVVKGKVKAASISIEPGAVVNGAVTIAEEKAMVVSLYQKIHKHTEEEYLSARWAYEQAQGNAIDSAAGTSAEKATEPVKRAIEQPKPTPIVVEQPIPTPVVVEEKPKKVEAVEIPTPVITEEPQSPIIAKEEVKTEPAPQQQDISVVKESPKKEQKLTPPKEDNIQRWW